MNKAPVSIKKLLSSNDRKVEAITSELETPGPAPRWTDRFAPSTKGGKCVPT